MNLNNDYDLAEVDNALSSVQHQSRSVGGPPTSRPGVLRKKTAPGNPSAGSSARGVTIAAAASAAADATASTPRSAPGTRRGSLMPVTSSKILAAGDGDDDVAEEDEDECQSNDGKSEEDKSKSEKSDITSAGQGEGGEKASGKDVGEGGEEEKGGGGREGGRDHEDHKAHHHHHHQKKPHRVNRRHERNLFHFDLREMVHDMLLIEGESMVSYHEYAVFDREKNEDGIGEGAGGAGAGYDESLVQSVSVMEGGRIEALKMAKNAVTKGWGLDYDGQFTAKPKGAGLLQGRTRQIIVDRRTRHRESDPFQTFTPDGLFLTVADYDSLSLHPATLPSLQRLTVESHFWDTRRDTLHLILSFSNSPQPPYDFLSMSYRLKSRTTTALIRRSFDARWHDEESLDEYERRLDACRARWAHPLSLPIVLLQVQLYRTEEEVAANNSDVLMLEAHVDAVTGTTGQANIEAWKKNQMMKNETEKARRKGGGKAKKDSGEESGGEGSGLRPLKRLATFRDNVRGKMGSTSGAGGRKSVDFLSSGNASTAASSGFYNPQSQSQQQQHMKMMADDHSSLYPSISSNGDYVPPQTIHLMKEAHDVLKGSIQLLDTLRWMERAVKLVSQAGDELDERIRELTEAKRRKARLEKLRQLAKERGVSMAQIQIEEPEEEEEEEVDELSYHWYEMKQYLECTWRLCASLETDRRMSELRCRAQIDIIYSKMAQEDNNLNARMAVASTRDSSSMKALAVITAVFLPGEYIGTLFGVSMFNWEKGTKNDPALSEDAAPGNWPMPTVMPSFWIYWAFTIPLTLFIVCGWRAWWVNQDRYFRRHLSLELSNERYWTTDGKPRELDTSFLRDFFSIITLSGGTNVTNSTIVGGAPAQKLGPDNSTRNSSLAGGLFGGWDGIGGGSGTVGSHDNAKHNTGLGIGGFEGRRANSFFGGLQLGSLSRNNTHPTGQNTSGSGMPEPGFLRRAWTGMAQPSPAILQHHPQYQQYQYQSNVGSPYAQQQTAAGGVMQFAPPEYGAGGATAAVGGQGRSSVEPPPPDPDRPRFRSISFANRGPAELKELSSAV